MEISKPAVGIIVVVALIAGVAIGWVAKPAPPKTREVTLSLDWLIGGQHAPFYVAKDLGYYSEAGLSVTIQRGYGSTDTINKVNLGTSDFGWADVGTLIRMRAEDVKVKAVALTYDKVPMTIMARKDAISEPKDLEGKVFGINVGDATLTLFPLFAEANDIDTDTISIEYVDSGAKTSLVIAGETDFTGTFTTHRFPQIQAAADAGVELIYFPYSEYGIDIYATSILTSERLIDEEPDLVRRFVEASLKGYLYTFENPEEAIEIQSRYVEEIGLDPEGALVMLEASNELIDTEAARETGLGIFATEKAQDTIDIIVEAYEITAEISLEDVFTSEFVPSELTI